MSYGRSFLQEKKGKEDLGSLKLLVQLQSTCQEVPLCPVRAGGQTPALPWGRQLRQTRCFSLESQRPSSGQMSGSLGGDRMALQELGGPGGEQHHGVPRKVSTCPSSAPPFPG